MTALERHYIRLARELRHEIQQKVKQAGLWAPHLPEEYGGAGLDFLEHAYMNEILAYSVGAAGLFGVEAPNSGNQKILLKYGTDEQKQKWLVPLTEGKLQSGFSMKQKADKYKQAAKKLLTKRGRTDSGDGGKGAKGPKRHRP